MNLHLEDIESALVGELDGRALDLVRIAAFAYAADQSIRRGGATDWRLEDWRRRIGLAIPVNEPALWSQPAVRAALQACLGFVSDDEWHFAFTPATHEDDRKLWLPEPQPGARAETDVVAAFSGGIDSLAAAVSELAQGRHVLLVSHESSVVAERRRRELAAALRERFGAGRFARFGVRVHRVDQEATERTRRSRSFLYAALCIAAACKTGATDVLLADNGVVSLNLPIGDHVIGSNATRSTHPRFLRLVNSLTSLVLDQAPIIRNPLWDRTRPDVLSILRDLQAEALVGLTLSCAAPRNRVRARPQCGVCSQCVDRRFAAVAAGFEEHDPADAYELDLFKDALAEGNQRAMVLQYVRFARRIDGCSDEQLIRRVPRVA